MIIDQALFGYSNGHHMLAGSCKLSNYSRKILEPLSDLSGSEMQADFAEYYTGCPLIEDNYYALSKTWYAPEMERPGCVWTHTLFIKFDDLELLPNQRPIWGIFLRPTTKHDFSMYSKPLYVAETNKLNESDKIDDIFKSKLEYLLKLILDSTDPILIPAKDADEYNTAMCSMWLKLASSYGRNFSFCTGSLANRTIEKKPLDLQIVPAYLLKSISRVTKNAYVASEIEYAPSWLTVIKEEIIYDKKCNFKDFILVFPERYISDRKYAKPFALLYSALNSSIDISVLSLYDKIYQTFSKEDCADIRKRVLTMLLGSVPAIKNALQKTNPARVLEELSTNINNNYDDLDKEFLDYNLRIIWQSNPIVLKNVFHCLICHDLNKFGERVIAIISSLIQPHQLIEFTGAHLKGSHVLVSFNERLALCRELWIQPKIFQMEILGCLTGDNNNLNREILLEIFSTSKEDICEKLYDAFGDTAIESYFSWANKIDNKGSIYKWAELCRFSFSLCIKELRHIQNIWLLECIVNALNPYSSEVLAVDKKVWIDIYHHFYENNKGLYNQEVFAQFVLPIIIQSNDRYPDDIAYFAFNEVHKKLANDQMDYENWTELSYLLPRVSWFNSWDKCKRLRKAAKRLEYSFDLYQNNDE